VFVQKEIWGDLLELECALGVHMQGSDKFSGSLRESWQLRFLARREHKCCIVLLYWTLALPSWFE